MVSNRVRVVSGEGINNFAACRLSFAKQKRRETEVRYLFYNSPGGTSQGVVYSGREVKLMNSILRLNPLALWEGAA